MIQDLEWRQVGREEGGGRRIPRVFRRFKLPSRFFRGLRLKKEKDFLSGYFEESPDNS